MPTVSFESRLYFDYDPVGSGQLPSEFAVRYHALPPYEYASTEVNTPSITHPRATVRLDRANRQWSSVVPVDQVAPRPVLSANQEYDVWVELVVPDNLANKGVGVFMVNTTLLAHDGSAVAQSKRPAILKPSYSLSSFFYAIAFQWLALLGYSSGEHVLLVQCFEDYLEPGSDWATTSLQVTLSNPYLQIHSARIYFMCKLYGIEYMMYYWQWTSFAVYMVICTSCQAVSLVLLFCIMLLSYFDAFATEDLPREDSFFDEHNDEPWRMESDQSSFGYIDHSDSNQYSDDSGENDGSGQISPLQYPRVRGSSSIDQDVVGGGEGEDDAIPNGGLEPRTDGLENGDENLSEGASGEEHSDNNTSTDSLLSLPRETDSSREFENQTLRRRNV